MLHFQTNLKPSTLGPLALLHNLAPQTPQTSRLLNGLFIFPLLFFILLASVILIRSLVSSSHSGSCLPRTMATFFGSLTRFLVIVPSRRSLCTLVTPHTTYPA